MWQQVSKINWIFYIYFFLHFLLEGQFQLNSKPILIKVFFPFYFGFRRITNQQILNKPNRFFNMFFE